MSEAHAESHLPVYKKVIVTLSVLTLVEFGISFGMHSFIPFVLGVLLLIGLAFWKAVMVARFFMHVKYDPSILAFIAFLPVILGTPIVLLVGFDLIKGPNL
jgi:caa(3)-type oxidase subunit IV